jgi:hypothetical protein
MRESRLYGFVRGARGNPRPYRDDGFCLQPMLHLLRAVKGTLLPS